MQVQEELTLIALADMNQHVADLTSIIASTQLPDNNPSKDYAVIRLKNFLTEFYGGDQRKAFVQNLEFADIKFQTEQVVRALLKEKKQMRRDSLKLALEILLFQSKLKVGGKKNKKPEENLHQLTFNYIANILPENQDQAIRDPTAMQSIILLLDAVVVSSIKIHGKGKMIGEATGLLSNSLF